MAVSNNGRTDRLTDIIIWSGRFEPKNIRQLMWVEKHTHTNTHTQKKTTLAISCCSRSWCAALLDSLLKASCCFNSYNIWIINFFRIRTWDCIYCVLRENWRLRTLEYFGFPQKRRWTADVLLFFTSYCMYDKILRYLKIHICNCRRYSVSYRKWNKVYDIKR